MPTAPLRLQSVVADFRRRLGELRAALRREVRTAGGWRNRAELVLVTATLLGLRFACLPAGGLLRLARWSARPARRGRGAPPPATVPPPVPAAPPAAEPPPPPPPAAEPPPAVPAARPIVPVPAGKVFPRRTFSALLCTYNDAATLGRAVEAVVRQSRPPDEYLILDDASTDETPEILAGYAARYPFIKVLCKEKNEGCNKGINELTRLAAGEYIHWGASDDYMLPGFIEHAMRLAEEFPRAGIISGELVNTSEHWNNVDRLLEIPGWATGYVTPEKYLHEYLEAGDPRGTLAPSTIFRRAAVLEMGGWRKELGTWDVSFVLQASALKYGMGYVDRPCYTWVYRKRATTHRANSDLLRSTEAYLNYLRLARTPPFRGLFSEKFLRLWFFANMELAASTFAEAALEQVFAGESAGDAAQPAA